MRTCCHFELSLRWKLTNIIKSDAISDYVTVSTHGRLHPQSLIKARIFIFLTQQYIVHKYTECILNRRASWIEYKVRTFTWYLLVELNGISQTLRFLALIAATLPTVNSVHLRRAASEASPAVALQSVKIFILIAGNGQAWSAREF